MLLLASTTETPMPTSTGPDRTPTAHIIIFCVAWIATATFHAAQSGDPVGAHYDTANRVFTLGLIALVALLARYRPQLAATAPRAATAAVAGAALALLGNVVEFWGGLLQDQPLSGTAERIGSDSYWVGSDVGFALFAAGVLILAVSTVVAARGSDLGRAAARAVRFTGPAVLVTFLVLDAGAIVTLAVTVLAAGLWLPVLRSPVESDVAVA